MGITMSVSEIERCILVPIGEDYAAVVDGRNVELTVRRNKDGFGVFDNLAPSGRRLLFSGATLRDAHEYIAHRYWLASK